MRTRLAGSQMLGQPGAHLSLQQALEPYSDRYDVVLVDRLPSTGRLAMQRRPTLRLRSPRVTWPPSVPRWRSHAWTSQALTGKRWERQTACDRHRKPWRKGLAAVMAGDALPTQFSQHNPSSSSCGPGGRFSAAQPTFLLDAAR